MCTSLVIGASGFLGAHVVRDLAERGENVRALVRSTSDTRGIEGLDVERVTGDVFDLDSIRAAMSGCEVVYYCVVDARPWLRDPTPMWRTNVEGLRGVLDVAAGARLKKFVFTSSVVTIGIPESGPATEELRNNWLGKGGEYARTRVAAEDLVMEYRDTYGLPAVAMCVANTYGEGDYLPTPHGGMVKAAVRGKMPFYLDGVGAEVVGIKDAARAMTLAGEHGRPGERYIVAERFMSPKEIFDVACAEVGVAPPSKAVSRRTLTRMAALSTVTARIRRKDSLLTPTTVRLMHVMPRMDHSKAVDELGWTPSPTPDAIAEAARFFAASRSRR
ncbi:putative NAD-dependent epimerase/dehydratase family protein [Gordonia araii NBRC 100433]|uniref:Putative NAD-dependent epimerase/dehydratase family protein n=1 Tax=Gordonia araii NBRC 100433 TaxID=1073574 RepID=G7H5U5_9ACTN|nr:NAD-dependent epimerase/dehydratase family protein [Gordonia araii]NNG95704.1 NAD-dependent epimerase/dehydratase family protein [Gordonia araii NBRC 100433]GAB11220.1 putative NAD-dependent epimerase/dehydratase family protein [Gordonia araii NBRC 100433]